MTLADIATISDVSAYLREMGEGELADRVDYLASDADLEPGDVPATDESALGFLEFYTSVESDSKVGLACSPQGWISAEWRWFPDERRVGIWFLDAEKILFSALGKDGKFVEMEERNKITDRCMVTPKLVDAGLFSWRENQ